MRRANGNLRTMISAISGSVSTSDFSSICREFSSLNVQMWGIIGDLRPGGTWVTRRLPCS